MNNNFMRFEPHSNCLENENVLMVLNVIYYVIELSLRIVPLLLLVKRTKIKAHSSFEPHSSYVNFTVNETASDIHAQNVEFTDGTDQYEYEVENEYAADPSFNMGNMNDAELGDFFKRPIRATHDIVWEKGTTQASLPAFNPWTEYFSDARVLEKIKHFNLLRCSLKVKMIVNGNQFHYGRLLASYIPLHDLDDLTEQDPAEINNEDIVQASQRPRLFIDPQKSQAGIMNIPYFWFNNFMSIPNEDWRQMGHLQFYLLNPLRMANGGDVPVRITILIWAEDVVLSIPTSASPGDYSPESGYLDYIPHSSKSTSSKNTQKKGGGGPQHKTPMKAQGKGAKDEYGKGPVSKPASYVAAIAGKLKDIPVIGPYARATEMAAGATAGIASVFGYSRPVTTEIPKQVAPKFLSNLANANVEDNSTKLALDVKQELCVDSRTMCLGGEDEMTINSIAGRESYLTTFDWKQEWEAEKHLYTFDVTPALRRGNSQRLVMPAMAFATYPFEYWTGTINFRFQIVSSALHKGRLKLVYDPVVNMSETRYNTAYTRIIDISEEKDFTVSIGWANERPFLKMPPANHIGHDSNHMLFQSPAYDIANGRLSLYVVNELVSFSSTAADADIEINAFVSAGDDLKVASPDSTRIKDLSVFAFENATPQSGYLDYEPHAGDETSDNLGESENTHPEESLDEENAPAQEHACEEIAKPVTDLILHSIAGETIASFRTCLKRYTHLCSWPVPNGEAAHYLQIRNNNFPFYQGLSPSGFGWIRLGATTYKNNFGFTTLLNYLSPAYVGWRGGIRWKYALDNSDYCKYAQVRRLPQGFGGIGRTVWAAFNSSAHNSYRRAYSDYQRMTNGWDGIEAVPTTLNPVVEVEIPFYSNKRFMAAKRVQNESGVGFDTYAQTRHHEFMALLTPNATQFGFIRNYVSTGEDFNLVFFTGAPKFYHSAPTVHHDSSRIDGLL